MNRRTFIAAAAGAGASLILPSQIVSVPKLRVSSLPIGTITAFNDSSLGIGYRILCDGDYWLPLWIRDYYLQASRFPVLFSHIGYTYGRRDIHNSVYGPEGEFALPYLGAEIGMGERR